MVGEFIFSLEPYLAELYFIHFLISLVLALLLSAFTMKRFARDTEAIKRRDSRRLDEIVNESMVFKLLFKVSLHKNNRITNTLFMFFFIFSMPVVGYIFALWITWYLNTLLMIKKFQIQTY